MKVGIIFDMDGVIIDNNSYHYQSWKIVAEKHGVLINPDIYRDQMNGRTLKALSRFIFGEEKDEETVIAFGQEKEAIYRKMYQPYLEPAKGLLPLLSKAYDEEIPMVVGTSAPKENVDFIMEGLGIRHYFEDILDDRSVTKGKPDPEIYEKCAAACGLENKYCVVIEDAVSGLKAGKAAGSPTIAIATSHLRSELEADIIIDSFEQLDLDQIKGLINV